MVFTTHRFGLITLRHQYTGKWIIESIEDDTPDLEMQADIHKMLQKIEKLKPTLTHLQVTVIETRLLSPNKATAKSISKRCKCSVPQVYLAEKKVMEMIRSAVLADPTVLPVGDHLDTVTDQE